MEHNNCPHCKASLIGEPIPKEYLENYGGETHYKLEIGLEYPDVYDGVWDWMCPFCDYKWPSETQLVRKNESNTRV